MTNQNTRIIRECDRCNKENSISCISGLCPSCEQRGLFTTDQNVLSAESWRLLLRKETENKYKRTQEEIIKGVFEK